TTQDRQNRRGRGLAVDRYPDGGSAKHRPARCARMRLHELAHLIDRLQAVQIAIALRVAPREEPVAAEHESVASRVVVTRAPQHQRKLEAGALPRHPDDPAPELFIER